MKPTDTVLLFYVGHGAYGTDGHYQLVSYDSQITGSKVVVGTSVSELDLLERLRKLQAQRILMVFNTCHSGELSPALGPDESPGRRRNGRTRAGPATSIRSSTRTWTASSP